MSLVVIDANVSLKWALNDEEAVVEAVALREAFMAGRIELVAPTLWVYEITNGLIVATRRKRIAPEISTQFLKDILSMGIRLLDPLADQVHSQAIQYNVSAYDAAYLTLAEELGVPLWTGDRRFYDAVRNNVGFVHWIGDYSL